MTTVVNNPPNNGGTGGGDGGLSVIIGIIVILVIIGLFLVYGLPMMRENVTPADDQSIDINVKLPPEVLTPPTDSAE